MDKDLINKCLDFAEGRKGKFTILMAKKPDFPETLIRGTEKQQLINSYSQQGMSTPEIADKLNCTQPNVVEHMRQYRKSAAFYYEWLKFWDFTEPIRQIPVSTAFVGVLSEQEISGCASRGIKTVGDFLNLTVTTRGARVYDKLRGLVDGELKGKMFDRIRQMCYKELEQHQED